MNKKNILILGGGFAGVECARKLEDYFGTRNDVQITIVSDDNFLLFTPMLPQVASGTISPRHIIAPIRTLCKYSHVYESEVKSIDPVKKQVLLEGTSMKRGLRLSYDYLVVALGSKTNFFGMGDVERNAYTMKTLGDAILLRNRIIDMLEQAENEQDQDQKKRLLTFVIVGGGFAGVETAGEINDFLEDAVTHYHNIDFADIRVVMIEALDKILPGFNERLARFAHEKLELRGIEIMLQNAVTRFDGNTITIKNLQDKSTALEDTEKISSNTMIWTAGIAPADIIRNSVFKMIKGQITVNEYLETMQFSDVYAIGDCAQIDESKGKRFPPTAQIAEVHAKLVAHNIRQKINGGVKQKFDYEWKGQSAIIGKRTGIAEAMGMRISGFLAWVLWTNYYLSKMPNFEKKLRVWLDWNIDMFFSRDISRYGFKRNVSEEFTELDEVDDVW